MLVNRFNSAVLIVLGLIAGIADVAQADVTSDYCYTISTDISDLQPTMSGILTDKEETSGINTFLSPNFAQPYSTKYDIAFWMKVNAAPGYGNRFVLRYYRDPTGTISDWLIAVKQVTDEKMKIIFNFMLNKEGSPYTYDVFAAGEFPFASTWYHIAVTVERHQYYPKTRVKLYVDGRMEANVEKSGIIYPDNDGTGRLWFSKDPQPWLSPDVTMTNAYLGSNTVEVWPKSDVDRILCATRPSSNANAGGDPHIKMWTGAKYDFHGACDLVMLQNSAYRNGLGMHIHIRTKFTRQWSYISTAVLQIGEETLEVMGGDRSKYWINKVEGEVLSNGISGFPITRKESSSISTEFEVDLKDGSSVVFKTYKDFVRVEVDRANSDNFSESLGMMGSYKGEKIARDGKSVVDDSNAFGLEWQVLPSDGMLFHNVEGAQFPEKCPLPLQSQTRRLLRESEISIEDAENACARVSKDERDSCIFDVLATNDKIMAGAY